MCEFNRILKRERLQKKIKMKDMAAFLGLGDDRYRKYERGDREPDLDTLLKIADYLKVSTDYLLGRYETAE